MQDKPKQSYNGMHQAKFRKRMKAEGFVPALVWVPPEDRPTINALAKKMRADMQEVA